MPSKRKKRWIKLSKCSHKYYGDPVCLNECEFVIVPDIQHFVKSPICKYNIYSNKWSEIWKSDGHIRSTYHSVVLNKNKDKLYLYGAAASIIQIDLKTNIYKTDHETLRELIDDATSTKMIRCNDKYYIVGNQLITFTINTSDDDNKLNLEIISNDTSLSDIPWRKKFDVKCINDALWIMGGKNNRLTNKIWSYKVNNESNEDNKWILLDTSLPYPMHNVLSVVTLDNKYLIIFSGMRSRFDYRYETTKDIYILNLYTMKWAISKIKCPKTEITKAILMPINNRLIFGFVRNILIHCPVDIVNLITVWYGLESLHLLKNDTGHWVINVTDILDEYTTIDDQSQLPTNDTLSEFFRD